MDCSVEYIEMCRNELIQGQLPRSEDEDGKKYVDGTTNVLKYDIKTKRILWLPRQDQLQGMMLKNGIVVFDVICRFTDWFRNESDDSINDSLSGEQIWLAFVMHEKYGKKWVNGDWVT